MSISETECRHCGDRIVPKRFLGRDTWTHQPAGAAFQDGEHPYCHLTTATPKESPYVDQ